MALTGSFLALRLGEFHVCGPHLCSELLSSSLVSSTGAFVLPGFFRFVFPLPERLLDPGIITLVSLEGSYQMVYMCGEYQ